MKKYKRRVKRIVVAPFFELAGEGAPPDFDRFRPSDIVILILFADGRTAAYPVGEKFCIDL